MTPHHLQQVKDNKHTHTHHRTRTRTPHTHHRTRRKTHKRDVCCGLVQGARVEKYLHEERPCGWGWGVFRVQGSGDSPLGGQSLGSSVYPPLVYDTPPPSTSQRQNTHSHTPPHTHTHTAHTPPHT